MNNTKSIQVQVGANTVTIEAGLLAQQAAGAVTVRCGDTVVFSAATNATKLREGIDYFPLQVEYREKYYAAGRLPGGYFKREARPSEREILVARMTDRPLRPLFPESYRYEVQINNALLCADGENESDVLSIIASSAALMLSEIPFFGPIAAVRIGRVDGQFVVNPGHSVMPKSDLDLVYAGTREKFIMMEGSAKEIPEADFLAAMKLGHAEVAKLCDAQLELRRAMGLPEKVVTEMPAVPPERLAKARELAGTDMAEAMEISGKLERQTRVAEIAAGLKPRLVEAFPELTDPQFKSLFDALEIEVVRSQIVESGHRIGGRGFDELRQLAAQVAILPRTHGSAVFMRGETQALATVTLGTHDDAQSLDAIAGGADEKRFLLHYNFPPYSVGEAGRLGFTSRREIGHGALAERSLRPMIPADYPYTVRVVSEIMGSNGSSSMASICAGTLALMDAGVKITKPVAGISIGLFTGEGKAPVLVTDILGTEDHCGDMDFKIAGTRDGITGFQVDFKIRGLAWDLVEKALAQAQAARMKILDFMQSILPAPRDELSQYAPRVEVTKIPTDKIGALIGPGGKNIRRITETYKVQIDVEDDGTVKVYSVSKDGMEAAMREIGLLTAEAEVGKTYEGRVTGIKEFGAFVEILPGLEGLVHVSEMANFRVRSVEDVCKVGDMMWVKCLHVDENGKIRLSRRAALEEKDGAAAADANIPRAEGGDQGGGDRGYGGGGGGGGRGGFGGGRGGGGRRH
jgi:polyribonucleotide nucleotidyltransferase